MLLRGGSMIIQKFIIEGTPHGQGRPRACKRGKHAGVYEAAEDAQYKRNVAAQIVARPPPYVGPKIPVFLEVTFYMPRPQEHFSAKGPVKENFVNLRPTVKPDLDNMLKAVKDAMTGIVWHDDSQVVSETVSKFYADTKPLIVIEVRA
jgi:Holliday junction resolvase RusA-like endonuclease